MSYFVFPKGNINISNFFSMPMTYDLDTESEKILSPSLYSYLSELEEHTYTEEFQEIQNEIFPYYRGIFLEYPNYSPSFFEIIEIVQTMHLNTYIDTISKFALHIFSFSNNTITKSDSEQEQKIGIHAIETIRNTKNYKSSTNNTDKKDKDVYFLENTYGNLYSNYSLQHFEDIYLHYASKLHIILADASVLKNKHEIFVQLCMILCIQAKKGILFWKIGDTSSEFMLEMLFFLSSFYEKMFFIKPFIMDTTKSEKYVVCKGFLYDNSYTIYSYLHEYMKKIQFLNESVKPTNILPTNILPTKNIKSKIPFFFLNKLEEINYIFGQVQLEQIHYILLLISHKYKHSKLENIAKLNIQKTTDWINKHYYYLSKSIFSSSLPSSNDKLW